MTKAAPDISKEKKLSATQTPFITVVVPKIEFTNGTEAPLVLPAYWLIPLDPKTELSLSIKQALEEVLTESLLEELWISSIDSLTAWQKQWQEAGFSCWAEKQFLPGVTDNLAHIVQEALSMQNPPLSFRVASGKIYLARSKNVFENTEYRLFHPLVEHFQIHDLQSANQKKCFTFPEVVLSEPPPAAIVDLDVSNQELLNISNKGILALSLEEMQAVKNYYELPQTKQQRKTLALPAWPTDIELEIIAQTWSEHCKHKIFNATIKMQETESSGNTQTNTIKSLYKSYIQKATRELQPKRPDLLSVFKDNSGIVKWNDRYAVCFKVETHNSPSALEPYGGSLTGILGVNRDVLGTGLGAKPIFNTDILCFAYPSENLPKRPKLLPPEVIMNGVRKGIQDGGNKSGIPTVNGGIVFHPGYRAKPLIFCGTGGILPLKINNYSAYEKHTKSGDTVVMAGGRVGKDGIHGATFSSEALHEGSPVTAVQIGDPFTQKRLLDFVLAARDAGLITGITDNGAGGLSSSVGEMATLTGGAKIDLDHVPTKYPGLAAWEIVVSESQERMTISTNNFSALQNLAKKYSVEISNIGVFNQSGKFEIMHKGKLVAALDLEFLHDGVPELCLEAEWQTRTDKTGGALPRPYEKQAAQFDIKTLLLKVLAHPNVCSRESVIRRYDHEVQGTSVIKPLMGEKQSSPCDAAVLTPVLGESTGLVISNGLCPQLSELDPYLMAQAALDEAIRNAVCVGADPTTISVLDNFCWPDSVVSKNNPNGKKYLGMLVKACQGLYDATVFMGTPLISGKDSMKNDFDDGVVRLSVPPTLLISAMGKIPDINRCITSYFKNAGDEIFLCSAGSLGLAGSIFSTIYSGSTELCTLDLRKARLLYHKLHESIMNDWISSAHDLSDGGLAIALAESIIGSGLGASINAGVDIALFAEGPAHIIVSVSPTHKQKFLDGMGGCDVLSLGSVISDNQLKITGDSGKTIQWSFDELFTAWNTPLPFA